MAKKDRRKVLGRGLSALLNDPQNDIHLIENTNANKLVGSIIELDIDKIEVNPYQPRTNFDEKSIKELADSIIALGIIQPITVRELDRNKYQLVSGERRFRASKSINLDTIPAYVRIANDQEILEMALVENIQRRDLDPIEIALSYQRLTDEINLTQIQLSERVGKERSTVANYMRLLKLDPIIQTGMRDGFLSMGHGRALINIEETEKQLEVYEKIISKSLSVRATETLVKNIKENVNELKPAKIQPKIFESAALDFGAYFNVKITVKGNEKEKGSIQIHFDSLKELSQILKKINLED